ncbi:MAG: hypothetical protein R6X32_16525 [Chloroflexota bacterium]
MPKTVLFLTIIFMLTTMACAAGSVPPTPTIQLIIAQERGSPTPTATATATAIPSATPTVTATFIPTPSPTPSSTATLAVHEFLIQATESRYNTELLIQPHQQITIEYVSGSWRAGPSPTWPMVGPEGDPQVPAKYSFPLPTASIMSLIGAIGPEGPVFLIGERLTFQSEQSGLLTLAANDDNYSDNAGSITVRVTIQEGN